MDAKERGQIIRHYLIQRDWTINKLAHIAHINNGHLSRLVRGEVTNPNSKTLNAIADAFNIPVSELTGDTLPPLPGDEDFARALLNALEDEEEVQKVLRTVQELRPNKLRTGVALLTTLLEEQRREQADLRAEMQRNRKRARDEHTPEDARAEGANEDESTPDPLGLLVLA